MSVSYAASKLRVPPGFEHLLEGLAREILREQPKDLLKYAAEYFRKKLQERDGASRVCDMMGLCYITYVHHREDVLY